MANLIDQQIYEIPLVFLQGDRDPEGPAKEAATKLGNLLNKEGWGVSLGAYGGFVKVLEDTGVACICHETEIKDHGDVKFKTSPYINFGPTADAVITTLGGGVFEKCKKMTSWSNRLAIWASLSKSYCFFAGREGTLAHLIPILTYNVKGWGKEGNFRNIALLGWEIETVALIMKLYGLHKDTTWFQFFGLHQVDDAINFLIS
ncbi:MAG: hypothetical protein WC621_03570 [Patescibacteria group bacterium]